MRYSVAALYRFTPLDDLPALKREIVAACPDICGTLLLAPEGVNGTIGGPGKALHNAVEFLDRKLGIRRGELKFSESEGKPFNRFKVRLKKEIITMKCPEADPARLVGRYVVPEDWNGLLNDPDLTLIDTRNIYETGVGTFKGAIDPRLETFSRFPDWVEKHLDPAKHRKVAMFCTGGIRCEKASSYMLARGFEEVYHLKGGILKYLEDIPAGRSLWEGECFVFDRRVAVTHGLQEGSHTICHGCRAPLTERETGLDSYEEGVSCLHCADRLSPERAAALRARHRHFTENRESAGS